MVNAIIECSDCIYYFPYVGVEEEVYVWIIIILLLDLLHFKTGGSFFDDLGTLENRKCQKLHKQSADDDDG